MTQNLGVSKDGIPRPRIQTLSDMIFGLALSIGAAAQLIQKPGNMLSITYSMFSFGFAFLILTLVWLRYSRIMSVLPLETGGTIAANMLLLFFVSLEPYLYNLMTISSYSPSLGQIDSAITSTLYAIDLGALMLILAYFVHELTVEKKNLIQKSLLRGYKMLMYTTIITASVFLLSALPMFWSLIVIPSPVVPLRYVMWGGAWLTNFGRRLEGRMSSRRHKSP